MERKCSSCANFEYRDDGEILVTDACAKCNWVVVGGNKVPSNWKAKPKTNADRIRAMDDELLATQLTQVFKEAVMTLTHVELPTEILNEVRSQILEKLKQPAEGD